VNLGRPDESIVTKHEHQPIRGASTIRSFEVLKVALASSGIFFGLCVFIGCCYEAGYVEYFHIEVPTLELPAYALAFLSLTPILAILTVMIKLFWAVIVFWLFKVFKIAFVAFRWDRGIMKQGRPLVKWITASLPLWLRNSARRPAEIGILGKLSQLPGDPLRAA
jgi:hypothetical protein